MRVTGFGASKMPHFDTTYCCAEGPQALTPPLLEESYTAPAEIDRSVEQESLANSAQAPHGSLESSTASATLTQPLPRKKSWGSLPSPPGEPALAPAVQAPGSLADGIAPLDEAISGMLREEWSQSECHMQVRTFERLDHLASQPALNRQRTRCNKSCRFPAMTRARDECTCAYAPHLNAREPSQPFRPASSPAPP